TGADRPGTDGRADARHGRVRGHRPRPPRRGGDRPARPDRGDDRARHEGGPGALPTERHGRLPLQADPAARTVQDHRPRPGAGVRGARRRPGARAAGRRPAPGRRGAAVKVLIAEDEPLSRRLLHSQLEKWGHEVTAAADGGEAWRLFQAGAYPLVISDWMMPEMDGPDLVRRVRGCERPGYVYIILLTSRALKEDAAEGMEAGADDL